MKTCRRCGNKYDTEKVLCPACMADPHRYPRPRLPRRRFGIGPGQSIPVPPSPPPNQFELDADYIKVADTGSIIPMHEEKTVYLDLNGAGLNQTTLDVITCKANALGGCVNIVLRRVGTAYGGVPRLIADRGEIYDALCKLLEERNEKEVAPPF